MVRSTNTQVINSPYFRFNDTGKSITILKIDVEGEEMWSFPEIVDSRVLETVKQVHIEVVTKNYI